MADDVDEDDDADEFGRPMEAELEGTRGAMAGTLGLRAFVGDEAGRGRRETVGGC